MLKQLKSYLEYRRSLGLVVLSRELEDRYLSLLRAEVVRCKLMLLEVRGKLQVSGSPDEVTKFGQSVFCKSTQSTLL